MRRLPASDQARIAAAIAELEDDPRPRQSKKLTASEMWRLRVGEYRILYTVSDARREVLVERIERRTTHAYD